MATQIGGFVRDDDDDVDDVDDVDDADDADDVDDKWWWVSHLFQFSFPQIGRVKFAGNIPFWPVEILIPINQPSS